MNESLDPSLMPEPTQEEPKPETVPLRGKRIPYFFTLIASLLGAAFQMVLLLAEYEPDLDGGGGIGMYKLDSVPAMLFGIYSVLVIVGICVFTLVDVLPEYRKAAAKAKEEKAALKAKKEEEARKAKEAERDPDAALETPEEASEETPKPTEPPSPRLVLPETDTPVVFAATLCGFILIAMLILRIPTSLFGGSVSVGDWLSDLLVRYTKHFKTLTFTDWTWTAVFVLTFPSAAFFFRPAFARKKNTLTDKALSFFPIFWCMAYLLYLYFNNFTAIFSPVRVLCEIALVASMLYFCMETRVRVGRGCAAALTTVLNIALYLSAICAIPLISVAFIEQWSMNPGILYSAVQLCFMTYFVARANTMVRNS